ncbi:MAG TPA: hypothetical protein VKZ18_14490 [Polyangia bacterium]|nr:hypothetical protein [Polyangia bacterium]
MRESTGSTPRPDALHERWVLVLTVALASLGAGCRAHTEAPPVVGAPPARGGLTIVHQDGNTPLQTFYLDSDRLRIESAGSESAVIIDARAQRVLHVSGDTRTYVELGPKEVELFKAAIPPLLPSAERELLDQELERLPAKEREAARATLDLMAGGAPSYTFERTPAKRTIDGIACDVYRVNLGGEPFREECIAPWSDGLFRREDFAALAVYIRSIKPMPVRGDTIFDLLDSYPGFPLTRVAILPHQSKGRVDDLPPWENRGVKRGPLPASLFTPPPGFTKEVPDRTPAPADPGPPITI